jgi:hypothetical protein
VHFAIQACAFSQIAQCGICHVRMNAGPDAGRSLAQPLPLHGSKEGGGQMNIMSALFRIVGKHRAASRHDAWWLSISYATGARRVYRHRDSRFIYPPSSRHVHFGATPLQNGQ